MNPFWTHFALVKVKTFFQEIKNYMQNKNSKTRKSWHLVSKIETIGRGTKLLRVTKNKLKENKNVIATHGREPRDSWETNWQIHIYLANCRNLSWEATERSQEYHSKTGRQLETNTVQNPEQEKARENHSHPPNQKSRRGKSQGFNMFNRFQ